MTNCVGKYVATMYGIATMYGTYLPVSKQTCSSLSPPPTHTLHEDIDECERFSPCDQICTNRDGYFKCQCEAGFQLDNETMTTCEGAK